MRNPLWMTPLVVAVATASSGLLAVATVAGPLPAPGVLLLAGAVLFVCVAPRGLIVVVTTIAAVIHQATWPQLGGFLGGTLHLGDVVFVAVCFAALLRCSRTPLTPLLKFLVVFLLFGVVRTVLTNGAESTLSFVRVMQPVIAGAVVGLVLHRDFDLWRFVRWGLLGVLVTVPLFGDTTSRWSGLPGGPNEVALVAAVLVVLGAGDSSKAARVLFVLSGLVGLFGSRGIGATVGALSGLAVLTLGRRQWSRAAGTTRGVSILVFLLAAASAVVLIPQFRPDLHVTLWVHTVQAESFWGAFEATNPLFGSGWSHVDASALADAYRSTHLDGLHNVYLDITVYLGAVGASLFLVILWHAWRPRDLATRAVLMTTLVWFNTTGAYPCAGWGILGLVVAASACQASTSGQPLDHRAVPTTGGSAPRERTKRVPSRREGGGPAEISQT